VRNNSYKAIIEDVCSFFREKSISELHLMKDILNNSPGIYSLNKYRIINSLTNKGKSSSYRCICVCLPKNETIYLDTIYPKTGSSGTENLTKEAYKSIARNIKKSIEEKELFQVDTTKQTFAKIKN
jgi:hypothetical protein